MVQCRESAESCLSILPVFEKKKIGKLNLASVAEIFELKFVKELHTLLIYQEYAEHMYILLCGKASAWVPTQQASLYTEGIMEFLRNCDQWYDENGNFLNFSG